MKRRLIVIIQSCLILALLVLLWIATAHGQAVFPGDDWQVATPGSQQVDGALLDQAMDYLAQESGSQGSNQALVILNGYMIWAGNDIDNQHNVWSTSKSFTSTILGLLIDDNKCTLDTLAHTYIDALSQDYSGVKLRHFATMTSGYNAVGGAQTSTPFTPTNPLFTPGSEFEYWDAAMNQFGQVLTHIAQMSMEELFHQRIADPIGMDPDKWNWGDWGSVDGYVINGGAGNKSKGISISARELARFCYLFLHRGNWDGTQLISGTWVDQATAAQVDMNLPGESGPGSYGFNWWTNGLHSDGGRRWPSAPPGTYSASGHNNNHCYVVPEWQMVIVRLGTDGNVDKDKYDAFFNLLASAVSADSIAPASPLNLSVN